ncbi:unnamed protein product [Microthlaspi erraticum]|uniref:CCHC-type domain-containing protein n=1 Tax=Microthlaspi erraticum TaxID=1685480 RepID=A0A6D2KP09_9BRAS|nr:unnamed protein product [Microthlaspi erraticum]
MASEEEEEETSRESPSSLNEAMLEQIKKMMIEEFDRREKIKEGKRKQPKDPVTSKKKPIEDLSGYMMIPPFHGNNDPDVYLDWERKCEITFNRHNIADINRVKLAAMEFKYYALSWWKQVETARAYSGAYEISTWGEMKRVMRQRFVPIHYQRELHSKLRKLTQESKTVEEYFQEMEVMMLRANVIEDREATMSRFLGGLNREIQDVVEMQNCVGLEAMLHKAVLAEQQLNRKGKLKTEVTPTTRAREVKCFKCQGFGHYATECSNRRVMIISDNGEIESEEEPTPKTVKDTEEYEAVPVLGKLPVTRTLLSAQDQTEEEEQRENLFYLTCPVQDEACSLITHGGNYTNVASETMVKKLGLKSQKHSSANDQELGPELEPNQEAEDHGEPKPKQPNKTLSNLYQGTKGESVQTSSCDLQEIVQVPSNDKVHARLPQIVYNDSMSCMMHLLFSKSVETDTGSSEEQWKQADLEKEAQSDQIAPKSKPPDQQLQGLSTTCFMLTEFRAEPHIQPDPGKCLQPFSISKTHEFSNVAGRIGLNLKLSNKKIRSEITISVEKAPNDELDHEFNPEPNNKWKSKTEQGYSQAMSTAKLSEILNQHIHPVFLTVLMHLSWFKEVEKGTAEQERRLEAHKALTCHTKKEYEQHVLEPIAAADSLMSILHNTHVSEDKLNQNQEEWLTCSNPIPEKPPDSYLRYPKKKTQGQLVLRTKLFQEGGDDMIMPSTGDMELEAELEPDGAKHVELEPDGIKDIKLEVEEKLDVMDKLVAN